MATAEPPKAGAAETRPGADGVQVKGHLLARPDPQIHGLAGRGPFAEAPALLLRAVLKRANDTGGRCALWPSGDAHRPSRSSAGAATSFGFAAPFARGARGARAVTLATHLAEGSVRVRGRACLRTPAPDPFGSLPASNPSRKGVEHRFEAAEDPFADRPVPRQGRSLGGNGGWTPIAPKGTALAEGGPLTLQWQRRVMGASDGPRPAARAVPAPASPDR